MNEVLNVLSGFLLLSGTAICLIGGIGMNRMPDFYSRIHAASMTDSLGAAMVLSGLMLQAGASVVTVKLLTVWVFLWLTSPAASHALAKGAHASGIKVVPPRDAPDGERSEP